MVPSNKSEKFRSKGLNIIKNPKIETMNDFLNGPPSLEKDTRGITQSRPGPCEEDSAPLYNKVGRPRFDEKKLGRLHIQIRQDLIEKLLDTVFERKRDPRNRAASQRGVIEDALEQFFKNETKPPTDKTPD